MKNTNQKSRIPQGLVLLGIIGAALPSSLQSAPLYWTGDANGTPNTIWNTSNQNWNATSATQPGNTAYTNGSDVVFTSPLSNSSANTVTISGTIGPASLTFRRDSGSGPGWTLTGGTLNLPATITQESGSNSAGHVEIQSQVSISSDVTFYGNRGSGNSRMTLSGNISGTGNLILENVGDFRITGSNNTYDGTIYLNGGAWVIAGSSRVVGSGARTIHVGDGVGDARSAFIGFTSGTAGLTSADTYALKSDGYIRANADNASGARLTFDGGGVIGREATGTSTFTTAQVTVLSGTGTALGNGNGGNLNLELLAGGGFDVAAGATFSLDSQYSKQSPATFIAKTGEGTLNVAGTLQTASTGFQVQEGALNFQSTAALPASTSMELSGGLLRLSNVSLTLAAFSLTANSALDFGSIDGVNLTFAGDAVFASFQLSVLNYDFAAGDRLRFWNGSAVTITDEQASQIRFGGGLYGEVDAMGYVSAVPEPGVAGLLAMGFALALFRRRRLSGLCGI